MDEVILVGGMLPQMLAVMEKDEGGILVGLLEMIADSYPQALYFSFNVTKSNLFIYS